MKKWGLETMGIRIKKTSLGKIPLDWQIKSLGDLTDLLTNGFVGPVKQHYTTSKQGVLYIQGYNVEENAFNLSGIKYVSQTFHKNHQKSKLEENDLLTVQTGDVGKTTIIPKEFEGANCHALIISRFKQDLASPMFYCQYFNSKIGRKRLKSIETGTTMKHLNVTDIENFLVPYPPLHEQHAIAEVLSDVDALIEAQETLIEKKHLIKQGVMQELLTGRRRLPGFNGNWIEKTLDECGLVTMGQSPPGNSYNSRSIGLPLLNGAADLREDGITISQYSSQPTRVCNIGDLLFCIRATIGNLQIADRGYCLGRGVASFTVNESLNKQFIAFQLQGLFEFMRQQSQGGVIKGLKKDELLEMKLKMPQSVKEQAKISEILCDIDREIKLHEEKLVKISQIKVGMMQELLTGRTRLV